MRHPMHPGLLRSVLLSAVLFLGCGEGLPEEMGPPAQAPLTELDKYIKKPDESYAWKLIKTLPGPGYRAYVIDMTSQTWRSSAEVDRVAWQHYVTIVVPDNASAGLGFLLISGGDNGKKPPERVDDLLATIAKATSSVAVVLEQVPNQPLRFPDGGGIEEKEDGLIAYSWQKAMQTGDAAWSVRFPMVKSAVRAMDTAQAFLSSDAGGKIAIERFVVAGASKRGWTTWLVGAVDGRVAGLIPIVIDVLNVEAFMRQHFETYGFWARSLADYARHRITLRIGTPELSALLRNEDPYVFRERLTMPKFVLNATGDQFFLPDGSKNYLKDLPGETYLRYVQNADHSLSRTDAPESALAYYLALREGRERPRFTYTMEGEDTIRIRTEEPPLQVNLWQAHNPKARDFRVETLGRVWQSTRLTEEGQGVYVARVPPPAQGYTAFFVELAFTSGQLLPFKFSTEVRIVPDRLPFAGQDPKNGKLEMTP